MKLFSVKEVSGLSGVSIKTLHHYDKIDLLKPDNRTSAGYRLYGEKSLLKLQQILFYKELEFSLNEIKLILEEPEFDLIDSLSKQKQKLLEKQKKFSLLINTIDKTINNISKGKVMENIKDLYAGLSEEESKKLHSEAMEKWPEETKTSVQELMKKPKSEFDNLSNEFHQCWLNLSKMINQNPESDVVQNEIKNHYELVRKLWGKENSKDPLKEQYIGLAELYTEDSRYTTINGKHITGFSEFLKEAIQIFVRINLK